jgi:septal ring factor EnvC (AmiA/AmiB activator)
MNGLNEFVSDHPAIVVLAFGFLWSMLLLAVGALRWFVKREFMKIEKHQERQDAEIGTVKRDVEESKKRFAVSQQSFDDLSERIDDHMKQEAEAQKVVSKIREDVAWIRGRMRENGK